MDIVAGGYEDWETKRTERKKVNKAKPSPPPPSLAGGTGARLDKPTGEAGRSGVGKTKLSYKDQRDYELLPKRIEELETAITKGEAILADPDLYSADPQKFADISKGIENARTEKDAAEERWLDLAERVEG